MTTSRRRAVDPVDRLVAQGADLLRQAATLPSKGYHRTPIYRQLAEVVSQLRACFHDADGRPDWAGRTFAYRQAVGRLYTDSGVPADVSRQAQSALRYHFGQVIRETATAEELEDLGLQERAPSDRVKDTRDMLAARARAGAVVDKTPKRANAARSIIAADVMLAQVDAKRTAEVTDDVVDDVAVALESIRDHAGLLLEVLASRRKRRGGRGRR